MPWKRLVSPVPALLVFLFGCLVGGALWLLLETHHDREERHASELVAGALARHVQAQVGAQLRGIDRLRDFWERFANEDAAAWREDAALYLDRNELDLLAVVDMVHAVPADEQLLEIEPEWIAAVRRTPKEDGQDQSWIVGDPGLVSAFVTDLPAPLGELCARAAVGESSGPAAWTHTTPEGHSLVAIAVGMESAVALAVLDPARWLRASLEPFAADFLLRASWGGRVLFERILPERTSPVSDDRAAPPPRWTASEVWLEPLDESIVLSVAPRPEWQALGLPGGTLLLLTTVLLSVLLGAVVHLVQVSRVQARESEHTNRELRARLVAVAAAEEEVRALNQSLEARVAERTEVLEDSLDELELFSASISHDLRSPLGAVLNFAAILREDFARDAEDETRHVLRRIEDSARVAISLMDGLTEYARIRRHELSRREIDMDAMVREVVAELRSSHGVRAASIRIGDLPSVRADPVLVRLVWMNLLGNALKFTREEKTPRIEVTARALASPAGTAFSVRDNGVGFRPEDAARLFDAFERRHTGGYEGHGIGLAIVRRIVRRHGGRVSARGAPGKGALLSFSLPSDDPEPS